MSAQHTAPEMLEALDNVTAALETLMAFYGEEMPAADRQQRERVIAEARRVIAKGRAEK